MHAVRMLDGVSTLGVVASRKRTLKPGTQFDAYFPKPSYSDPLLTPSGENIDTIATFIPRIVSDTLADTKRISLVLKGASIADTCAKIFAFVYEHIQYELDSPSEEQIRRPSRTWADRKGDCDCYATFISSILTNLSIPHYLRMSAYSPARGYQHIYVIVPKKYNFIGARGSYWVIDPVLDKFDDEKLPMLYNHDQFMPVTSPLQAGTSGLAGFPIRNLNGAPAPKLRNSYVYDNVYYSPQARTWALKGLDGGLYIQGDVSKRVVPAMGDVGDLGFIDTALRIGAKIGKKVLQSKAVKKIGGKIVGAVFKKQIANAVESSAPSAPESAGISAMSASTGAGVDNTDALTRKIQAANKANVMSLNAVDKGMTAKLNAIAAELNKSVQDGQSFKDTTQHIKAIAAASLARTESAEAKAEETSKQQNTMLQKMEGMSKTNIIMLVAMLAIAILLVIYLSKR